MPMLRGKAAPVSASAPSPPPAATKVAKLVLTSAAGAKIQLAVRTPVGKHLYRELGEESQFMDSV